MATDYKDIMNHLPQGPGSRLNSDTVDGIQTSPSHSPRPNTLVPLDSTGKLPSSVFPNNGTWALVSNQSLASASSVTFSGLSPGVKYALYIITRQNTSSGTIIIRFNSDTGSNYSYCQTEMTLAAGAGTTGTTGTSVPMCREATVSGGTNIIQTFLSTDPSNNHNVFLTGTFTNSSSNTLSAGLFGGKWSGASDLSSCTISTTGGTLTGAIALYKEGVSVVVGETGPQGPQGNTGSPGPSGNASAVMIGMIF